MSLPKLTSMALIVKRNKKNIIESYAKNNGTATKHDIHMGKNDFFNSRLITILKLLSNLY